MWSLLPQKGDSELRRPEESRYRLSDIDIHFDDEITEMDDRLNFYIRTDFNVDAVFGTYVENKQNGDWLNVYANYDITGRQVCNTLDIILHRDDGRDEELSYALTDTEKKLLLSKMVAYCLEREGVRLDIYCAQLMNEDQDMHMEPRPMYDEQEEAAAFDLSQHPSF